MDSLGWTSPTVAFMIRDDLYTPNISLGGTILQMNGASIYKAKS